MPLADQYLTRDISHFVTFCFVSFYSPVPMGIGVGATVGLGVGARVGAVVGV